MYYSSSSGFLDTLGSAIGLVAVALTVLYIVALWRIFQKACQPGWAAIVPFYNNYILFKILWGNGWLSLSLYICWFLELIPIVGILFLILFVVIGVLTAYKRAVAFGQSTGFAVGLFFLPIIFDPMLAFGNYFYHGVPQDGTSYDQLRSKLAGVNAQSASMNYQQPPREPNGAPNNMRYTPPNGASNNGYYPPNGAPNNNGYYSQPNNAQNNTGYYSQPNGAQNNTGYYSRSSGAQNNTGYYSQSNGAQNNTGYYSQPNNAQGSAGYTQPTGAQNNAATRRCPKCGNLCGSSAQFCGKCGTRFY